MQMPMSTNITNWKQDLLWVESVSENDLRSRVSKTPHETRWLILMMSNQQALSRKTSELRTIEITQHAPQIELFSIATDYCDPGTIRDASVKFVKVKQGISSGWANISMTTLDCTTIQKPLGQEDGVSNC